MSTRASFVGINPEFDPFGVERIAIGHFSTISPVPCTASTSYLAVANELWTMMVVVLFPWTCSSTFQKSTTYERMPEIVHSLQATCTPHNIDEQSSQPSQKSGPQYRQRNDTFVGAALVFGRL
jgi:hypothetical protein